MLLFFYHTNFIQKEVMEFDILNNFLFSSSSSFSFLLQNIYINFIANKYGG